MNKIYCHDCKKEIKIKGKDQLVGAKYLVYDQGDKKLPVIKCNACYKKNPALTNYQPCEVYSRIVGYLRPVQQWNEGKQHEYAKRMEYKISKNTK